MPFEIYISSKVSDRLEDVVNIANSLNVNIELKSFVKRHDFNNLEFKLETFGCILQCFKGKLSIHAPYSAVVDPYAGKGKREKSAELLKNTLYVAQTLGASIVNYHTGFSLVKEHLPNYVEDFLNAQIDFWGAYIHGFEKAGIVAVLENTTEYDPELLIKIVDSVNSDNFKLCIDTGHINNKPHSDIVPWILNEGQRLHHMHLHNNYGILDEHNSLLKGSIDFKPLIQTLKENDLRPSLLLEIFDYEETLKSLEFLRSII